MKRSEINRYIKDGINFFEKHGYILPPFAFFKAEQWLANREACREIFDLQLGWDLTSFGSDDFENVGLLLFTTRNGALNSVKYPKPYAEKIMMVLEEQLTPCHFHWNKREDIINRGGGNLVMEVWQANENDQLTDREFTLSIDGMVRKFSPGDKLVLHPGEGVCLEPYIAHCFYGEKGFGPIMVGEVSSVNDDSADNCFINGQPRFDNIIEDEDIQFYLASDYSKLLEG